MRALTWLVVLGMFTACYLFLALTAWLFPTWLQYPVVIGLAVVFVVASKRRLRSTR